MRISDDSVMRIYRQTLEDFGLFSGLEMSVQDLEKLRIAAGAMSAKMRAVRIVSATNVSKRDLEQRLIHKGEDPKQAKDAVNWMSDMELVDDRKTAEQIVHRCIQKGYRLSRAKQMLYQKQIPKSYWDEVLADYPEQTDAIVSFLRVRLGDEWDDRDVRKAIDALIRRGHNYSEIRKGLEQLAMDTDEFPEE